jgi:hypothetical protein
LQLLYPNEKRFAAESFGNCPTLLIEQAMQAAEQAELERLHKQAVPLGALGQIVAVGNGWKDAPTSYCNPYEGILQKQEARAGCAPPGSAIVLAITPREKGSRVGRECDRPGASSQCG